MKKRAFEMYLKQFIKVACSMAFIVLLASVTSSSVWATAGTEGGRDTGGAITFYGEIEEPPGGGGEAPGGGGSGWKNLPQTGQSTSMSIPLLGGTLLFLGGFASIYVLKERKL